MDDLEQGGGPGVSPRRPDGGWDPVTGGPDPPPVPSGAPALVRRFVSDDPDWSRYYVLRVALDTPSDDYARGLVEELETEVEVLGTTLGDEGKPDDASFFSVVAAMDYDPKMVVGAMVQLSAVAGITVVEVPIEERQRDDPGEVTEADESDVSEALDAFETTQTGTGGDDESDDRADDRADELKGVAGGDATSVVTDDGGTETAEAPVHKEAAAEDSVGGTTEDSRGDVAEDRGDDSAEDRSDDSTEDRGEETADPPGAGTAGTSEESPPAVAENGTSAGDASANHPTFDELKRDIEPVSYDSLVDELESTTLPGEFQDTADLQPVLDGASATGKVGEGSSAGPPEESDAQVADDGALVLEKGDQAVQPDAVVEALVTAVEADALTDDQRRALSRAVEPAPPKTMQVKLEHLQREVDELVAYKETLETFIDEYGSGDGLVKQVREAMHAFASDVERIGTSVETVQSDVERTSGEVETVKGTLAETVETVEDLRSSMDRTDDRVETATDRVESVAGRVEQVDDRVESVTGEVEQVDDRVETVTGRVDDVDDRLAELDEIEARVDTMSEVGDRLDSLAEDLETLRTTVEAADGTDESVRERLDDVAESIADVSDRMTAMEAETGDRLDEVSDRLGDVEQRLDEHDAWRRQFHSLLSGTGAPGAADQGE